jgi:hypothetical protein
VRYMVPRDPDTTRVTHPHSLPCWVAVAGFAKNLGRDGSETKKLTVNLFLCRLHPNLESFGNMTTTVPQAVTDALEKLDPSSKGVCISQSLDPRGERTTVRSHAPFLSLYCSISYSQKILLFA